MKNHVIVPLLAIALAAILTRPLIASAHAGIVTFGGLPVPGATVTATQGDKRFTSVSDTDGAFRFADLGDGMWTIRVEMLGFAPIVREVAVGPGGEASSWELQLLPFDQIASAAATAPKTPAPTEAAAQRGTTRAPNPPASTTAPVPQRGFQRAGVTASPGASAPSSAAPTANEEANGDRGLAAADGFVVNGSVNNGAASPFAQLAAFGNNRRGARSLYNGGVGVMFGTSAFDTRPFSFTGDQTPKPSYDDVQIVGNIAGPVHFPGVRNRTNLFLGFQRTTDHNASESSVIVPTSLERAGNFSQTRDLFGRPISIVDPSTGLPFPGNVIPQSRIAPQAASLLGYYPTANVGAGGRYNYQTPTIVATHQDAVQSRLTHAINGRNQLFGNLMYQQTTTDTTNVFGFLDSTRVSGLDTAINWSHRFSQLLSLRLRYQFTRLTTSTNPYFANRINVSGDAGIAGNNQDPVNWGPPSLSFSSGVAGLSSAQYLSNVNETNAWSAESIWSRGRHTFTFGGDLRRLQWNVLSQQDARGSFTFTGNATGSDLADFLLGIPHTSSIAFGNADKYLRAPSYDAYFTDDFRVSPGLTVNAGVRWEYESPVSEIYGRLVNLDVAPGFTAARPTVATDPQGALTGRSYPDSLVRPDVRGIQPRIGIAWRPIPGSSTVVRAGYGIYRNTSLYQPIAMLLAQQPPLSKTLSVENTATNPLTLANGFIASPVVTPNTFAVDPDLRVGYAHNWQVLVQRDLPASLTVTTTYLGSKGSHLLQEFVPNTYPLGVVNPCPLCPSGFVYLTSNGSSNRQAGQFQVRRRLRSGLTASLQYTLAKATDDAGAFTGVRLSGTAIAQDWLNLEAEQAPSNFDQRHLITAQVQYTTGVGLGGGALLNGVKGTLLKGWTFVGQMNTGSGLPLTPIYLTSITGTGITGTIRPDLTGAPTDAPAGAYANPSAYSAPAPGHWGTAGRNSITGRRQFSLDAGITRSFAWGDRLNLDWRVDATNVLNRVTYASVNTIVGSPQFGLPNRANPMRKVQTSVRMRW